MYAACGLCESDAREICKAGTEFSSTSSPPLELLHEHPFYFTFNNVGGLLYFSYIPPQFRRTPEDTFNEFDLVSVVRSCEE